MDNTDDSQIIIQDFAILDEKHTCLIVQVQCL